MEDPPPASGGVRVRTQITEKEFYEIEQVDSALPERVRAFFQNYEAQDDDFGHLVTRLVHPELASERWKQG